MSKSNLKKSSVDEEEKVRLDKWLWAARFFKTRALAKQAIEGGKVHYNGSRSKCSRVVELGAMLKIRQGFDEKIVRVEAISGQRRGAPEAAKLYRETEDSVRQREASVEQRRALRGGEPASERRPTKKDRRRIIGFKQSSQDALND